MAAISGWNTATGTKRLLFDLMVCYLYANEMMEDEEMSYSDESNSVNSGTDDTMSSESSLSSMSTDNSLSSSDDDYIDDYIDECIEYGNLLLLMCVENSNLILIYHFHRLSNVEIL